jgi:hypothetical protein
VTYDQYVQLYENSEQALCDDPQDDEVRRHLKGLIKALSRWLRVNHPRHAISTQARNGSPRPKGHASVNATLASKQETVTWQESTDDEDASK